MVLCAPPAGPDLINRENNRGGVWAQFRFEAYRDKIRGGPMQTVLAKELPIMCQGATQTRCSAVKGDSSSKMQPACFAKTW